MNKYKPYNLVKEIGKGGWGTVHLADADGFQLDQFEKDLLKDNPREELEEFRRINLGIEKTQDSLTEEQVHQVKEGLKKLSELYSKVSPEDKQKTYSWFRKIYESHPVFALETFECAIKILDPKELDTGTIQDNTQDSTQDITQEVSERFKREYNIGSRIKHPNLVETVNGCFNPAYLVMPVIHNIKNLNTEEVDLETGVNIISQVLEGLIYFHQLNKEDEEIFIHRDIKPSNIYFQPETGIAKLADYGIVKLKRKSSFESKNKDLTADNSFIGTNGYAAPETFTNKYLTTSDIYSLGATLYFLIIRSAPGEHVNPIVYLTNLIEKKVDWVREKRPYVSQDLENIMMMNITFNYLDRPKPKQLKKLLNWVTSNGLLQNDRKKDYKTKVFYKFKSRKNYIEEALSYDLSVPSEQIVKKQLNALKNARKKPLLYENYEDDLPYVNLNLLSKLITVTEWRLERIKSKQV